MICDERKSLLRQLLEANSTEASLTKNSQSLNKSEDNAIEDDDVCQQLLQASQALSLARQQIWFSSQRCASDLLSGVQLTTSNMPLEEFLQLLAAGYKFIAIGDSFSSTKSTSHLASLKTKSEEYVLVFHRESFQLLRSTLEAEVWLALQMPNNYEVSDIKELKLLKQNTAQNTRLSSQTDQVEEDSDTYRKLLADGVNPFDDLDSFDDDRSKSSTAVVDADSSNQTSTNDSNSASGGFRHSREVLKSPVEIMAMTTASSLSVARFFGKFMAIMRDLSPLCLSAFEGLQELFDFYLYAVFTNFGMAPYRFWSDDFHLYPQLRMAVRGIRNRLERGQFGGGALSTLSGVEEDKDSKSAAGGFVGGARPGNPPPPPPKQGLSMNRPPQPLASDAKSTLSGMLTALPSMGTSSGAGSLPNPRKASGNPSIPLIARLNGKVELALNAANTMSGAVNRMVATESLLFLVQVISASQTKLKALLPRSERHRVTDFVTYSSSVASEFKTYIYRNLAPLMISSELFKKIMTVKWEAIQTIQSKHNPYIDIILQALKTSKDRLEQLGTVAPAAMQKLWTETVDYVSEQLVISYSKIQKCTTEGRALMAVDVNILKQGLEKLTGLRPLPCWEHLNDYVIAFYYPENDFLEWVVQHPGYSFDQYWSIASCGICSNMSKVQKSDFKTKVEAAYRANCERKDKEREAAEKEESHKLHGSVISSGTNQVQEEIITIEDGDDIVIDDDADGAEEPNR